MTHVKQESNKMLLQGRNKKEQGYNKETYPKLVLNKLNIMGNSTFNFTYYALKNMDHYI